MPERHGAEKRVRCDTRHICPRPQKPILGSPQIGGPDRGINMDGMNYLRSEASEPTGGVARLGTIGRAMVITAVVVVLTLGVLVALRLAGARR